MRSGKVGRSKTRLMPPIADATSLPAASLPTSTTIVVDPLPAVTSSAQSQTILRGLSTKWSRIFYRRDVIVVLGFGFVFFVLYSLTALAPSRISPRRAMGSPVSDIGEPLSRSRPGARMPQQPEEAQIQIENPIATDHTRPEEVHTFKFFPPAVHHCALPNNQQDVEELGTVMPFLNSRHNVIAFFLCPLVYFCTKNYLVFPSSHSHVLQCLFYCYFHKLRCVILQRSIG